MVNNDVGRKIKSLFLRTTHHAGRTLPAGRNTCVRNRLISVGKDAEILVKLSRSPFLPAKKAKEKKHRLVGYIRRFTGLSLNNVICSNWAVRNFPAAISRPVSSKFKMISQYILATMRFSPGKCQTPTQFSPSAEVQLGTMQTRTWTRYCCCCCWTLNKYQNV